MVTIVSVGVLSIQGAVSEHLDMMARVFQKTHRQGTVIQVRCRKDLDAVDALIIPGGESTTISRMLIQTGLHEHICKRIQENSLAILGTCAGCVLLAKEIMGNKGHAAISLAAMDMEVERNAFGRQKESCEQTIKLKGFNKPYMGVFIRAPIITRVWGDCEILAKFDEKIVAARQHRFLAISFHPELTQDLRIHEYFLKMV